MKKTPMPSPKALRNRVRRTSATPYGRDRDPDAELLRIRRLERQLAKLEAELAVTRASAETDVLLNVLNRRGLERELKRAIAYVGRYQASAALIFLDVDRLKPINDAYGHDAGDAVLVAVSECLRRHVRASDVVARIGGDEFVLLLWHLTESDARLKAAVVEARVDALRIGYGAHVLTIGVSAGVAMLDADMDTSQRARRGGSRDVCAQTRTAQGAARGCASLVTTGCRRQRLERSGTSPKRCSSCAS